MTALSLPDNPRILVIALRRLGDVLLTTPLIRSLKLAYPGAAIEALVFAGTEGIVSGNPDLSRVIAIPQRLGTADNIALLWRLAKRYDLAVSTQTGDRPTTLAWIAGRRSAGPVNAKGLAAAVKRFALSRSYAADREGHRVLEVLRLAELLGIPARREIVGPAGEIRREILPIGSYAVVHAVPMFTYKRWTMDGWRRLATALRERGLQTVVTGGKEDRACLDEVWQGCDAVRLDGILRWPELAAAISAARVYVGPDTAITHLAAATGAQTVALYGPTDPRIWGPWPVGGLDRPWAAAGTIQRRGNVWLIQNPLPCLPCQQEGCERRLDSHSRCLDELSATHVISVVDQALAVRQAA
jgi:heptosyltransferase III